MPTRNLPNVLFVGPMKAGTSWLYEYLKGRGDVLLPDGVKETFFFDDRFESKGIEWYASHFQAETLEGEDSSFSRIAEVAPTYFHSPEAPQRIRSALGEIDIVVTLRDPADRAFSLFQHMRRYGMTRETEFRSAVENSDGILASSHYFECLTRWESAFGKNRVSVMDMQDLKTEPAEFARGCCELLSLASTGEEALPGQVNVASEPRSYLVAKTGRVVGNLLRSFRLYQVVEFGKRLGLKRLFFGDPQKKRSRLSKEDRQWFISLIEDDLKKLQAHLGRDISAWLS